MREDEIERALADAYAYADRAFIAINGSALESHSTALAALAETVRQARDEIGLFDLPRALKQSTTT